MRFALFHVLQAGARAEQRAIPAKGLTGPGYDGHTFWDTETFVLPRADLHRPRRAPRDALRWRHATLDLARERADGLGLDGAAFPWRTIRGQECSGYWPAGTAAFHINADIADAVVRYRRRPATTSSSARPAWSCSSRRPGCGARWATTTPAVASASTASPAPTSTAPIADNNVYTNLMAQRNLLAAADAVERHPDRAARARRRPRGGGRLARRGRGHAHPLRRGRSACTRRPRSFTEHAGWDFAGTGPEQYPLLLHFPYFDLYRKQVVKQADLVLAMHLRGATRSRHEEKARNFDYYEALTVRDSSLSACIQAVIAAEVGHLELAYDYFGEAALMDLRDLDHNTRDGVHIASLGRRLDRRGGRASAGCATTTARSASRPGSRDNSPAWPSASSSGDAGSR